MTRSEQLISEINKNHFLREFTYSTARFKSQDRQEREFADNVVWIDDLLILLQIKERNLTKAIGNSKDEVKWYRKQVEKKAIDQLASNLSALHSGSKLELRNERGDTVDLAQCAATNIHKLVVFAASPALPPSTLKRKCYISKRIGFVHLIEADDYINLCRLLFTPFEFAEYLSWRQNHCLKYPKGCNAVFEKSLAGQFISSEDDEPPHPEFECYTDLLITDVNEDNIYGILKKSFGRAELGNAGKQHYLVLKELAKFTRGMMKEFRSRLLWGMKECHKKSPSMPCRIAIPKYDCSYVFIPLNSREKKHWHSAIVNFTNLSKYAFKTRKAIGLTIAPLSDSSSAFVIYWYYLESEWEYNAVVEKHLHEHELFRSTKPALLGGYKFS